MLHDISITPDQAKALGRWVRTGPEMAAVELRLGEDDELIAEQGDDRATFDEFGESEA